MSGTRTGRGLCRGGSLLAFLLSLLFLWSALLPLRIGWGSCRSWAVLAGPGVARRAGFGGPPVLRRGGTHRSPSCSLVPPGGSLSVGRPPGGWLGSPGSVV